MNNEHIWYHDGIEHEGKLMCEGSIHDWRTEDLHHAKGKVATLALYTVVQ